MKKVEQGTDTVSRKLVNVKSFLKREDRVFERDEDSMGPELAALHDKELSPMARLVYSYIRTLCRGTHASAYDIAHDLGISCEDASFAMKELKDRKYIEYWTSFNQAYTYIEAPNVMNVEWSFESAARYLEVDVKKIQSFKKQNILTASGSGVTLFSLMVLKRYQITKRESVKRRFLDNYQRIQYSINL
jgi:hypothetical protein